MGGEELPDLPAGQPFAASQVIEAGLVLRDQRPNRFRSDSGGNGAAELVGEQLKRFARLPSQANLLGEAAIACWRTAEVQRRSENGVPWIAQHNLFSLHFGF